TFYRNVADTDVDLAIWHLPAEKTFGIRKLYNLMMTYPGTYGATIPDDQFISIVQEIMGVPHLTLFMRWKYYTLSYHRALKKRWQKLPILRTLSAS
ncbi:MAG: hypothetical protein ABI151_05475, partial [Chitinophagaceae bacterium]